MNAPRFSLVLAVSLAMSMVAPAAEPEKWKNGPSTDPGYFPIAVWLQSPGNAAKYKAAGINTYVGLWDGPTEEQLAALKKAGMRVICDMNAVAKKHLDDPLIMAWMHGDEPDNAQANPGGKGYGPPIPPEKIVADYEKLRAADPTRPVVLNLGQGVAWDQWYGRGVRTNHPEDYPKYLLGGDIVSFDIYPAVHDSPEVAGKLNYVGKGVERLVTWSKGERIVWNCLECTRIGNVKRKPTPHEVRAEAWMSIIHGSRGLIWFVHQFKPTFREAALLDDAEMVKAVTAINKEITEHALVINAGEKIEGATVATTPGGGRVALLAKQYGGMAYLFAVEMEGKKTEATFTLPAPGPGLAINVWGEEEYRKIEGERMKEEPGGKYLEGMKFTDHFDAWQVHIYAKSLGK